jgi:acetone carboxylase gamma subunit
MARRVSEYLEIDGRRMRCARCGEDICDAGENYKLWVLQDRAPVTEVPGVVDPALYGLAETLELRRYYCPGCVVQIETEVALPHEAPLWDIEIEVGNDAGD